MSCGKERRKVEGVGGVEVVEVVFVNRDLLRRCYEIIRAKD